MQGWTEHTWRPEIDEMLRCETGNQINSHLSTGLAILEDCGTRLTDSSSSDAGGKTRARRSARKRSTSNVICATRRDTHGWNSPPSSWVVWSTKTRAAHSLSRVLSGCARARISGRVFAWHIDLTLLHTGDIIRMRIPRW